MPLHSLRADSPVCPPDWRWRRAHVLAGLGRCVRRREDALVVRLAVWLRARERRPRRSAVVWPEVKVVDGIYCGTGMEPARRADLEGFLLAGESDPEVGQRLSLPPEVVAAYHDLCFDVRGRREAPELLLPFLIPESQIVGEHDRDVWVRVIGLLGGPAALDAYLEYLTHPTPGLLVDLKRMSVPELEQYRSRLEVRRYLLTAFPDVPERERIRWDVALQLADIRRYGMW